MYTFDQNTTKSRHVSERYGTYNNTTIVPHL